jgi:outer membrane protein TolC
MSKNHNPRRDNIWLMKPIGVLGAALLLSACKTFSPDGGIDLVAGIAATELGKDVAVIRHPDEATAVRERVEQLLRRPLSADAAVQIALLNNRGLQAAYNALGIAEAEMVEASLPPSPAVSLERLASPLEIEIERRIVANILALLTLPARATIAADRFLQAQLRAAEETIRVAAETRRAYYRTVAAREAAGFLAQAKTAAETASQLAKRLGETGAMNKLDQAREHVFYAEITAQVASARQRAASEREKLTRAMGLWGGDVGFKLPGFLPPLPRRPQAMPDIEVAAIERRIDEQIARMEVDALAKSYGLTQASRFINLLEVAGIKKTVRDKETGEKERSRGFEVELQVPIFDFGEVRVRKAEQTYMQAVNRLAEKAVNARSEAREAYRAYRSSYDIAAHYQREVLPLRKIISDETQLRYSAMQIDVFSLLAEARQRTNTTMQAMEAQREFWLASVDLGVAVIGGAAAGSGSEGSTPMTAASGGEGGH